MVNVYDSGCHSRLNPSIFKDDSTMREDVRERLLEIVDEFVDQIDPSFTFDILDIVLVGSNASYNYTVKSDLDLHLVVNLAQICKERPEIVQLLFNSEKSRFNLNYDIEVKGVSVEVYVEDVRAGTVSNGIYTVLFDTWVKYPSKTTVSMSLQDSRRLSDLVDEVKLQIEQALTSGDSREIKYVINLLYTLRKQSLEVKGELGLGNLAFKEIRGQGLLDQLKDKYYETRSNELTLEGVSIEEDVL